MVQSYYHLRGQIIGRGQKQAKSCVAAAAYRSGEKLKDERQGRICKYDKKEVAYSEILVPQHAPDWCKERGKLWNSVEAAEKSKNAQLAREINMTLAPELSLEQNKSMLLEYVNENFISRGMIADVNIHNKPDNLHAHIMLTMREIDRDGEWLAKSRKEYITDGNGERIKLDSGEWKSRKVDCNDWNSKNTYNTWCENWSKTVNRHLEKAGSENRIDHRSYKKQGINQIPTIHLGPNVSAMEKKGIRTEKGDINREIRARNAEIKKEIEPIKSKLSEAEDEVIIAFNAIIERAREKMLLDREQEKEKERQEKAFEKKKKQAVEHLSALEKDKMAEAATSHPYSDKKQSEGEDSQHKNTSTKNENEAAVNISPELKVEKITSERQQDYAGDERSQEREVDIYQLRVEMDKALGNSRTQEREVNERLDDIERRQKIIERAMTDQAIYRATYNRLSKGKFKQKYNLFRKLEKEKEALEKGLEEKKLAGINTAELPEHKRILDIEAKQKTVLAEAQEIAIDLNKDEKGKQKIEAVRKNIIKNYEDRKNDLSFTRELLIKTKEEIEEGRREMSALKKELMKARSSWKVKINDQHFAKQKSNIQRQIAKASRDQEARGGLWVKLYDDREEGAER